MKQDDSEAVYLFRSFVNSFHYLYEDANHFHKLATEPARQGTFEVVSLCRTSLLLYILSLEGLINRALDEFLPDHLHDFILDREKNLNLEDKWSLLSLAVTQDKSNVPNMGEFPWSHFRELVRVRNDYVHPKHQRVVYYKHLKDKNFVPLQWNQVPNDADIRESDIIYRQTMIPKDPYAIQPEHVDMVKRIVDDVVVIFDKMLGGKLFADDWLHNDQMTIFYPPGSTLADVR